MPNRTSRQANLYSRYHPFASNDLKVYDGNDRVVTLTNLDGTNDYTETGIDYSLMTYCTRMLSSASASDEMRTLAQAAIDYGTAAQIYFDHNAEGLAVSDKVSAVTLDDLVGYKGVFEGTLAPGRYRKVSYSPL